MVRKGWAFGKDRLITWKGLVWHLFRKGWAFCKGRLGIWYRKDRIGSRIWKGYGEDLKRIGWDLERIGFAFV